MLIVTVYGRSERLNVGICWRLIALLNVASICGTIWEILTTQSVARVGRRAPAARRVSGRVRLALGRVRSQSESAPLRLDLGLSVYVF